MLAIVAGLLLCTYALENPLNAMAIDHDKVVPLDEAYRTLLVKQIQPAIYTASGCVPFPPVDAAGRFSIGLKPENFKPDSNSCSGSSGQMFTRATEINGNYGIMYATFLPKEQKNIWIFSVKGHKYSWRTMVVLFNSKEDPTPYAVRYLNEGIWKTSYSWKVDDNGHPIIGSRWETLFTDVGDHGGSFQPLVEWDDIPEPAQNVLEFLEWGNEWDQLVRFNQAQFLSTMNDAWVPRP